MTIEQRIQQLTAEREECYAEAREINNQIASLRTMATHNQTAKVYTRSEEFRQQASQRMKQRWQLAKEGTAGEPE